MTTAKRRGATPIAPPLPDLSAAPDGWTWQHHGGTNEVQLRSRDYHTKWYDKPERAIAEAERYIASQPKAAHVEGPSPAVRYVPLDQIRTDGGTQARAGLHDETVAEYAATWSDLARTQNGFHQMPPIVVFYDGEAYWLADGFHRLAAYRRFLEQDSLTAAAKGLLARVEQGTRRDAVLHAAGANADHGLRRTTADKERAVLALLRDDEWSQWSDREIARRCKVSHEFVGTVASRSDLTGRASSERKAADGRTMNVSGIARSNEARAQPTDDQVAQMRERFYALGYEQFYASDAGWTAYHPKTKKANYKTWNDVEADITRKEAMAAAKICDGCGGTWGRPGSMVTNEGRLCQDCAAARLSSGKPFESTPAETADQLPPDFDEVQRRYAALGTTMTYDAHRGYIMRERQSGAGIVDPNWATVVATLETRERGRAAMAAAPDGLVPQYPERSAVAARLRIHGWAIQSHFGHEGTIWLVQLGKNGGSKNVRDWAAVVAFADQLDGVTTPTPIAPIEPAPVPCEDCGQPSTNKRMIGGTLAHRCDACAIKDELAALCERAEALGAQINYLAIDDPAMVQVTPPARYQQRPLPCNAQELATLIAAWEANAAPAPAQVDAHEHYDWTAAAYDLKTEIGLMAMNTRRTPRDYASALLRGLAAVMPHIQTESLEDLSQAINDLNECEEGTEAAHWIAVGYALLDLEPVESEAAR